jgi:hypothetical protein
MKAVVQAAWLLTVAFGNIIVIIGRQHTSRSFCLLSSGDVARWPWPRPNNSKLAKEKQFGKPFY